MNKSTVYFINSSVKPLVLTGFVEVKLQEGCFIWFWSEDSSHIAIPIHRISEVKTKYVGENA